MTEVKHYKCDICGKEHPTQEKAKKCEDFHELLSIPQTNRRKLLWGVNHE